MWKKEAQNQFCRNNDKKKMLVLLYKMEINLKNSLILIETTEHEYDMNQQEREREKIKKYIRDIRIKNKNKREKVKTTTKNNILTLTTNINQQRISIKTNNFIYKKKYYKN